MSNNKDRRPRQLGSAEGLARYTEQGERAFRDDVRRAMDRAGMVLSEQQILNVLRDIVTHAAEYIRQDAPPAPPPAGEREAEAKRPHGRKRKGR